jgi:hypothetical protein
MEAVPLSAAFLASIKVAGSALEPPAEVTEEVQTEPEPPAEEPLPEDPPESEPIPEA